MKIIVPHYIDEYKKSYLYPAPVKLSVIYCEDDPYSVWSPDNTYALGDVVVYHEEGKHWIIKSLIANNKNNIPLNIKTDPNWVVISWANKWRMLDGKFTSQTIGTYDEYSGVYRLNIVLSSSVFSNGLALLNVDADSVTVTAKQSNSPFSPLFLDRTYNMISTEGITDPWSYFFAPIERMTEIVIDDIQPYGNGVYTISLTKNTSAPKVGVCILGTVHDFGYSDYGLSLGITDYSTKAFDEFGDITLVKRSYSKRMSALTNVEADKTNYAYRLLSDLRATPVLYIGATEYASSYAYGVFKDYSVIINYPTHSLVNIEIEGMS